MNAVCAVLLCVLQELEADVVALMAKRVYDVAGVLNKGCKVTRPVPARSFGMLSWLAYTSASLKQCQQQLSK
jgi:hypothetical protein